MPSYRLCSCHAQAVIESCNVSRYRYLLFKLCPNIADLSSDSQSLLFVRIRRHPFNISCSMKKIHEIFFVLFEFIFNQYQRCIELNMIKKIFQPIIFIMLSVIFFNSPSFSHENMIPRIAVVYDGKEGGSPAEMRRAIKAHHLELMVDIYSSGTGGLALTSDVDLGSYALVFVDGATKSLPFDADKIVQLRSVTKLVVVNPQPGLDGNVSLATHPDIARYWANRSTDNDAALLTYLGAKVLGLKGGPAIAPPVIYAAHSFYHPDAPQLFASLEAYLDWYRTRPKGHAYDPDALTLGMWIHQSLAQRNDLAAWDALIAETERRGQNAVVLIAGASPDLLHFRRNDETVIDALLYGSGGGRLNFDDGEAGRQQAKQLGVPVLMALNHHSLSPEAYRKAPGGYIPDLAFRMAGGELDGALEPIVVSARDPGEDVNLQAPLADQIEWRITRALAWARLHKARNAEKKVVFTFWSEAGGKSDVGGDPDDFLDVPGSLAAILPAMRERGYDVGDAPLPDAELLGRRMAREASNMGNWSAGEIARRVHEAKPILLPEETYIGWFNALPEKRRQEIEAVWGPPPGKTMIYTDPQGRRFIVIPRLEFGNVLVAPHPMWGYLEDEKVLLSKDALPPHHQYLAFFLWLQKEWHADAWVSLFSNIVLQPGNVQGPMADDHIGILLGGLPHIHPERLGANGGMGNKRKGLAAVPGWYNIVVPSDFHENLGELNSLLTSYRSANDLAIRDGIAPALRRAVHEAGIGRALALDVEQAEMPVLLEAVDTYLAELERANMPWGGKVLGTGPSGPAMSAMVSGMLGKDLFDALAPMTDAPEAVGRALVDDVVNQGREVEAAMQARLGGSSANVAKQLEQAKVYAAALQEAPREVGAIFAELDGRWVEPGPMGEPFRRPEVLPPGRVLYNFDINQVPTVAAEAIGVRLAEAQINTYRQEHGGAYPNKLAYVLWSAEIAKNDGVTEAQVLHLLGTRVVRNWRGEVVDVALIPREELGRPRVDVLVTTSGAYRDSYQSKVELITKATQLAAASREADNAVARAANDTEAALVAAGETAPRARQLALARVFSPAPGAYSPSIQFLAKSGDQRGDEARMADLFTRRLAHAYGGGLYGDYARSTFEKNLARTDAATLSRSSDVNGLLDHSQSAAFLGGLNLAAKAVTGEDIALFITNIRDPENPTVETARRALQTEMRTRYFNPKWIAENQAHGYDGARNFMFLTDHLDLWDSTATNEVSSADWSEVKSVYVDDKFDMKMQRFFDRHNPHAHQMLLTNLLGAAQRGHWAASREDLAQVAEKLAQSVIENGPSCDANQCRNAEMTAFVAQALAALPGGERLLEGYRSAIDAATGIALNEKEPSGRSASVGFGLSGPRSAAAPAPAPASEVPPELSPPAAPASPPAVRGQVMEAIKLPAPGFRSALTAALGAFVILLIILAGGLSHWRRHSA